MKHKIYKIIYNYTRILVKHIYIYMSDYEKYFYSYSIRTKM